MNDKDILSQICRIQAKRTEKERRPGITLQLLVVSLENCRLTGFGKCAIYQINIQ
ncbi:hypothetical protein IC627_15705 [Photobacterium damselae subsp. piscicida]|uniref:Uncharacterized protein n=1 Tax=Photobacterium damsela subsp. piscicida TaxID=38294 RepID=A0A7L8A8U6_PHODP|nr:hypothetical protein [Photobacterium damselae]MBE8127105.1 hypothetical protein [Photobacterium damselae subsp. piscicida]QOD54144.1 hypothetical protein IC628_18985 [Photobacterium damselae subsp. piscicida]QOD58361.1 hypothetical protein IC627_15705 [Photobacterium damselae subsp. piscicida]